MFTFHVSERSTAQSSTGIVYKIELFVITMFFYFILIYLYH